MTPDHILILRAAHHAALEILRSPECPHSGIQIWRKLCTLEREVHEAATAQCSGAPYRTQPFRSSEEWSDYLTGVRDIISRIFGHIPQGFYVNGDARGHALKLKSPPDGASLDWGGDMILAATI